MDAEFKEIEIVFAQKLASGEPVTRRRAFQTLCNWIRTESQKREFSTESMLHLSKGLHYVMWMQDKMLWQEQLADNIASLLNLFKRETESILFIKCMLVTLSNEWPRIDRWRMDKFLMLIRRLVRAVFLRLRLKNWEISEVNLYLSALKECVISSDKSFSEGLKFHFASVFLDELDGAGGLRPDQVTEMLKPYAELLADRAISDYLFDSILQEIFISILHQYAEEKAAETLVVESPSDQGIKFDYEEIGRMLFEIGKKPSVKSARRKRLFNVAKKFKAPIVGEDPFMMATKEEIKLKPKVPKTEITKAVSRLLNEQVKNKSKKKKANLKKKVLKSTSHQTSKTGSDLGKETAKVVKKVSQRKAVLKKGKQRKKF